VVGSSFQGVGKYTNHFIEGGVILGSLLSGEGGSKNAPSFTQDYTKPTGFSSAHKQEHFSVKDKNQKKVSRVWKPKR
jgi:hypothetical protein